MIRDLRIFFFASVFMATTAFVAPVAAQSARSGEPETDVLPTIASAVQAFQKREGLLITYLDEKNARLLAEIPPPQDSTGECARLIHVAGLTTGLGATHVGLDRGQLGDSRILVIRRIGRRILFEQANPTYRDGTGNVAGARAARESFATSVLFGAEAEALNEDGTALVDLTPFIVRDAFGAVQSLESAGQKGFSVDLSRSTLEPSHCLSFPDNLEFEATVTFASDVEQALLEPTTPDGQIITLVQHQSFVRLPNNDYVPRLHDPRAGAFSIPVIDVAAPLGRPTEQRLSRRHRLTRTDPATPRSPVTNPLVYYVDPGIPEPIRSAVIDGARWWEAAFEEAGLQNAFTVEILPDDIHPLDSRYHVIEWTHRNQRGWSYGATVSDPRTGEIIKAHVTLGALRIRQDIMLLEGLLGATDTGTASPNDPAELALARIRQLAAHEVGHTLGLAHNFAASTYGNRASVMDYPAPLLQIAEDGSLDASKAYAVGTGSWDRLVIRWLYGSPPPGSDEAHGQSALLTNAQTAGLLYLSDDDARPSGSANARASLWDNGSDPVTALQQALDVRQIAIDQFGASRLAPDEPLGRLAEVFAPVYLHHRYQLDATIKLIGGIEYDHRLAGDAEGGLTPVGGAQQRQALQVITSILDPHRLDVPDSVLALLTPPAPGTGAGAEALPSGADPVFDTTEAAAIVAQQVTDGLLHPIRCNRIVELHRRDPSLPSIHDVLGSLVDGAFASSGDISTRLIPLMHASQHVVVTGLMALAQNPAAVPTVKAALEFRLSAMLSDLERADLAAAITESVDVKAHRRRLINDLRRFSERANDTVEEPWEPSDPPPGSPIGSGMIFPPSLGGCSLRP